MSQIDPAVQQLSDTQQQQHHHHQHQTYQDQHHQHQQSTAAQACGSCRRQKRKCDKQFPACGLCQRIGRVCDYTADTQAATPSAEEFEALRQKVVDLEHILVRGSANGSISSASPIGSFGISSNGNNTYGTPSSSTLGLSGSPLGANLLNPGFYPWSLPGASTFPHLFFLDSNAFEYERYQIPAPFVRVPSGALSALGSSQELRGMVEKYFVTVHRYFPIVSKIRLYQHLSNPLHEPGADMALLFLTMKLATHELPDGSPPQTQLYQDTKTFVAYVEGQNGLSIQLMQALLLISLYELGHAIYPAAYLTVGHTARLGHAMGLHERNTPTILPRPTTWTEQEERRRVWWGVVILDRFVNIGNRGKPFASADPSLDTHLPTDDDAWDRGHMLVAAPLALSASETIHAAPFARTCQASHLLGKIIRHTNDQHLPLDYRFSEALQLARTMRALASLLPSEAEDDDPTARPTLCTSMAISYSGLLTLYDAYSCTERFNTRREASSPTSRAAPTDDGQLVMQKESIDGLSQVSETVLQLARRLVRFVERAGLAHVSPLVVDAVYQAAANYAWYVRETSGVEYSQRLAELKDILRVLDGRWRVAGEYVRIIESTEFSLTSAIR